MYGIPDGLMQEIVSRIVRKANPLRVILFGSRARGDARPESDLDLLVVAEDKRPRALRASELYGVLSDVPIPMDILVYQPHEIKEWSNVPQAFVTTAVREGILLYEDHN
jgi:predicted nucleotidyltransferase